MLGPSHKESDKVHSRNELDSSPVIPLVTTVLETACEYIARIPYTKLQFDLLTR